MSRENVEIVRRVLGASSVDAAQAGAAEAVVERLAPDIEFEEDPRFPEAGVYRGRSEVLRYFRQFTSQFDQFVFEIEDVLDAGEEGVMVCLHLSGRGMGSGAAFDFRPAWLYSVRDGQVVRIRAYLDRHEALEAVGLRA